jgi:hypothetical protein
MKLYVKARKGHHGRWVVKSVHHAERFAARMFCRRWARGQESE